MAILHDEEPIRHGFQNQKIPIALFLDFQHAFECIPHRNIIADLRALGLDNQAIQWFQIYLANRTCKVVGPDGQSRKRRYHGWGVPQGSSLASLLFTMVIHHALILLLPRYCECVAYADDVVLLLTDFLHEVQDLINPFQLCQLLLERWQMGWIQMRTNVI